MPDPSDANAAPKLIIDSDWKSQAQAEKDRLAAKSAQKGQPGPGPVPGAAPLVGGAGAGGAGGAAGVAAGVGAAATGGHTGGLPEANWQALMGTMVSQALMYMGAFPDPETGRPIVSLEYAKFHIDLLEVLLDKTKGNLTEQEASDLKQVLSELRLRYVELTQAVAKMYAAHMAKQTGKPPVG